MGSDASGNIDDNIGDAAQRHDVSDNDEDDAKMASTANKNREHATYDDSDDDDIEMLQEDDPPSSDEEEEEEEESSPRKKLTSNGDIESKAVQSSRYTTRFVFDEDNGAFCEIDMEFPSNTKKILMVGLIEKSADRVVVHEVKGISRCFEYINPTENDTSVSSVLV
jgi:DNA-directed RNA polymerase I subunit RPA1